MAEAFKFPFAAHRAESVREFFEVNQFYWQAAARVTRPLGAVVAFNPFFQVDCPATIKTAIAAFQ